MKTATENCFVYGKSGCFHGVAQLIGGTIWYRGRKTDQTAESGKLLEAVQAWKPGKIVRRGCSGQ